VNDDQAAFFRETCEEIGFELASRGHQIVVCSTSPDCADLHVVDGANRAGAKIGPVSIACFVSTEDLQELDGATPYSGEAYPYVDCQLQLTHRGWFSTYDIASQGCDAAIGLGGTPRGTGGALYITLSKGRPVVAVPASGGFSRELWDEFATEYSTLANDDEVSLLGHEPKRIATGAVNAVESLIRRNPFPRPQRGLRYLVLPVIMIAIGVLWTYLTTVTSSRASWLPYAVALVTAAGGMLFRYTTDDARKREAYAGVARVSKDATRVLGAILGLGILLKLGSAQVHNSTATDQALLIAWLGLVGYAAGFLIEQVTEILTRTLSGALGGILKGTS
jgi:hypothetical protein